MLNSEEIKKLARLARIKLTAGEEQKFAKEISAILGFVGQLQQVKTGDFKEIADERPSVLRPDRVIGVSLAEQSELINQAPEVQDNLIKTKPVF